MSRNKPQRSRPGATSEMAGLSAAPEPVLVGDQVHAHSEVPNPESPELPKSRSAEVRDSGAPDVPKFAQLERKDARLRPDQTEELYRLTRELSQARTDRSERITENTLIRVALDMLFARSDSLRGNNEDEIRKSGTSGVRKSRR